MGFLPSSQLSSAVDTRCMVRDKVRIRFRKGGDLRLISHHDLMRCFERMLRRAALPFHSTEGFNPKPRLVFAMPLPLGVVGLQEVAELELDEELPPEAIHACLARQAPVGLVILDVYRIDIKATAHVRRACYRVALPAGYDANLSGRVADLLGVGECWVERSRPQPRRLNIKPYLSDVRLLPGAVEVELFVTPTGTARPEEVLGLLGMHDLLEGGAIIERTMLELEEECLVSPCRGEPQTSAGDRFTRL
jgi:radical SAM-linked protein